MLSSFRPNSSVMYLWTLPGLRRKLPLGGGPGGDIHSLLIAPWEKETRFLVVRDSCYNQHGKNTHVLKIELKGILTSRLPRCSWALVSGSEMPGKACGCLMDNFAIHMGLSQNRRPRRMESSCLKSCKWTQQGVPCFETCSTNKFPVASVLARQGWSIASPLGTR